jgi:hypothetical protein
MTVHNKICVRSIAIRVGVTIAAVVSSVACLASAVAEQGDVELFSPGLLPAPAAGDAAPAFSPDGRSVYVGRRIGEKRMIVVSRREGESWSTARTASFSGTNTDLEPAFDPNGRYLIFASSRPTADGTRPLDG